jgi:hypothetical protein
MEGPTRPTGGWMQRAVRRWRYGAPVIIVSGLPRSGTSMMMRMLEAGGVQICADAQRGPDLDNPHGYYELERVKHLANDTDKRWLRNVRGEALKVISHLLPSLPDGNFYQVIFMQRDLEEVLASQNKMLARRNEPNPVSDERARLLFERHLVSTRRLLDERPNFCGLDVRYRDAQAEPARVAREVAAFLGRPLATDAMARTVDPELWRNRGGSAP